MIDSKIDYSKLGAPRVVYCFLKCKWLVIGARDGISTKNYQ
jgi:hypothetical protein